MKNILLRVSAIFLILLVSACSSEDEDPIIQAQFDLPERVLVGEFFSISDVTLGASGYIWDFGNGLTSTEQNPQELVYLEPGIYTVKLTVISSGQAQTTTQREVVVGQYQAFRMELSELYSNFQGMDMDIYYTINEIQTPSSEVAVEQEIVRSALITGFNSDQLPLSIDLDGVPVGGRGHNIEHTPVIRFFNAETDDIIAASGLTIGEPYMSRITFSNERQEGNFILQAFAGSKIGVHFQAIYPNDIP